MSLKKIYCYEIEEDLRQIKAKVQRGQSKKTQKKLEMKLHHSPMALSLTGLRSWERHKLLQHSRTTMSWPAKHEKICDQNLTQNLVKRAMQRNENK